VLYISGDFGTNVCPCCVPSFVTGRGRRGSFVTVSNGVDVMPIHSAFDPPLAAEKNWLFSRVLFAE